MTAADPRRRRHGTAPAPGRAAARAGRDRGQGRSESTSAAPWPGKCLAHAATPAPCRPATNATVWQRPPPGPPERPHADHRIGRIGVDVGAGRQVEVDARGPERRRGAPATARVEVEVIDGTQGGVAGHRAAGGGLESRDVPALLVEGDQHAAGRRAWMVDATARPRRPAVPAVEAHAAEPAGDPLQQPGRHPLQGNDASNVAAAARIGELGAHPSPPRRSCRPRPGAATRGRRRSRGW